MYVIAEPVQCTEPQSCASKAIQLCQDSGKKIVEYSRTGYTQLTERDDGYDITFKQKIICIPNETAPVPTSICEIGYEIEFQVPFSLEGVYLGLAGRRVNFIPTDYVEEGISVKGIVRVY
jgi:hypothetical protein